MPACQHRLQCAIIGVLANKSLDVYIYMHGCVHVSAHASMYVCMHACVCACFSPCVVYMHTCMCDVSVCTCMCLMCRAVMQKVCKGGTNLGY